jgi:hypothetical protein
MPACLNPGMPSKQPASYKAFFQAGYKAHQGHFIDDLPFGCGAAYRMDFKAKALKDTRASFSCNRIRSAAPLLEQPALVELGLEDNPLEDAKLLKRRQDLHLEL